MSNLDSVSIDSDMAKVFEQTNKVLEKTQDQAEKNMDAGGVDIGIDNTNPVAHRSEDGCKIGGGVGFACTSAEGMN